MRDSESYDEEANIDIEGIESQSKKRRHEERSETRSYLHSVNVCELEKIQKNQEITSAEEFDKGNMMKRLEAKIETAKRKFRYPPKIVSIADVFID